VWLLLRYEFQATFLTAGTSLWFLIRLWQKGEIFGKQAVLFAVWFVVALMTELLARGPGTWIAGLLAQLALAIVLILKHRMDSIY